MGTNEKDITRALNDLARHQLIRHLYLDILADMQVCDIEGWDKMEYLRMLKEILDHFTALESKKRGGESNLPCEALYQAR